MTPTSQIMSANRNTVASNSSNLQATATNHSSIPATNYLPPNDKLQQHDRTHGTGLEKDISTADVEPHLNKQQGIATNQQENSKNESTVQKIEVKLNSEFFKQHVNKEDVNLVLFDTSGELNKYLLCGDKPRENFLENHAEDFVSCFKAIDKSIDKLLSSVSPNNPGDRFEFDYRRRAGGFLGYLKNSQSGFFFVIENKDFQDCKTIKEVFLKFIELSLYELCRSVIKEKAKKECLEVGFVKGYPENLPITNGKDAGDKITESVALKDLVSLKSMTFNSSYLKEIRCRILGPRTDIQDIEQSP